MFPRCASFHASFDNREEVNLWKYAYRHERDISHVIASGQINALMPGAPPGTLRPGSLSAALPNSDQHGASGWYLPEVSHLTTQPTGYISPLASTSAAARGNLSSSYEAAVDIVQRSRSGPFDWADKHALDLLQSGDVSSKFKPASVLNLPYMEKHQDKEQFSNIKGLDDLVTVS